jgi:GTP-binding protein Era
MPITKTAVVTIAGRPNVGKSTLCNALVGEKIAIVSPKPQATRNRVIGVVNRGETQLVLVDTPGFHRPRNKLGDYMQKVVRESIEETDCVLMIVEPVTDRTPSEEALICRIEESGVPCVLAINKIDTVPKEALLAVIASYAGRFSFDAIIPISAKRNDGLDVLLKQLETYAVDGPQLFPDDVFTDQPEQRLACEILREKMMLCLDQEIPHGLAVEIESFKQGENGVTDIGFIIYCEKQSHKSIIIGKDGSMLITISSKARPEIERMLGTKVFMKTWVKVKENWRDSGSLVRRFGYE